MNKPKIIFVDNNNKMLTNYSNFQSNSEIVETIKLLEYENNCTVRAITGSRENLPKGAIFVEEGTRWMIQTPFVPSKKISNVVYGIASGGYPASEDDRFYLQIDEPIYYNIGGF